MIKPIIADFPGEFQKPNISALMGAFDAEITELSEVFESLIDDRTIDAAEGKTLDLIGSAVGLSRAKAFEMAQYAIPELLDSDYRKLIKIRAHQMASVGNSEQFNEILKIWNEASSILYASNTSITAATNANREMTPIAAGVTFVKNYCPAPKIHIEGDTLYIENVGGYARYYDIYLGTTVKEQTMSPIASLDLTTWELLAGYYAISVKAYAPGWQASPFSNSVLYTVRDRLSAPVISISGKIVSWSAVSNASGYRITAEGDFEYSMETSNTSADLYAWLSQYATLGDEFDISVVALGEGLYTDSNASNVVSYTLNDAVPVPTVERIGSIIAITDTFEGVEEYEIYLDGNLVDTINA